MNKTEFLAMNNPIRAWVQEVVEIKTLKKYIKLPHNKLILEIGCGNGTGTKLIKKHFHPKKIEAIDLDPKMIQLAEKRNKDSTISFTVGDAAKLPYKDNMFDVVFDFAIIHHIPNWQDCLKEIKRVLKPGGQFIIEDLSIETFENPLGKLIRKFLDHPYKKMFKRDEFFMYLESQGWHIANRKIFHPLGFQYFIVIAAKPEEKEKAK